MMAMCYKPALMDSLLTNQLLSLQLTGQIIRLIEFYFKELDSSVFKIRYALIKNFEIFFGNLRFIRYSLKVIAIYINEIFID